MVEVLDEIVHVEDSGEKDQPHLNQEEDQPTSVEDVSSKDREILTCIESFQDILRELQDIFPSFSLARKDATLQQLQISQDNLFNFLRPKEIELPKKGSIRQIQANVTQTRLGHGRRASMEDDDNEDGQTCGVTPSKHSHATGALRRKHQRGRHRVQFEKRQRIHCPHCCSKTLMISPSETVSCHTCHVLLPLSEKNAPKGSQMVLINRVVQVSDDGSHT